jgi:hypothetical protein
MRGLAGLCIGLLALPVLAREVPTYDYRQPMRDGVILVGMECHKKNHTLEIGIFYPSAPPGKPMDLWRTDQLVTFDRKTNFVDQVNEVRKSCVLDGHRYQVRFLGIPGAANAMWMCGASESARATVWRDGQMIFDEDLDRCGVEDGILKARFSPANDKPVIERAAASDKR